jgi:hypothetical protein
MYTLSSHLNSCEVPTSCSDSTASLTHTNRPDLFLKLRDLRVGREIEVATGYFFSMAIVTILLSCVGLSAVRSLDVGCQG